jgi:diguanylate cyclase (GGDEF)-like protein
LDNETFLNLPIEVAVYDANGRYQFVNLAYEANEKLRHEMIGKNDFYYFESVGLDKAGAERREEFFKRVLKEKKTVRFTEQLHFPTTNKTYYYTRFYQPIFSPTHANKINNVCLFGNNMTAVILSQKELKYLVYHDKLTGLNNRESFNEQLDQIVLETERYKDEKQYAVLFCDLDNFKKVNDSLGHDAGDLVLKEVASRMKLCLRKTDLVYRLAGDEFTVIINHIKHDYDAAYVAEKIIKYLSSPFLINGQKINYVTTSIGIVLVPQDGSNREELIKKADTAMYKAKNSGKNNFQFFSKDMTMMSLNRLKIESNLRAMISENDYKKQFEILYQPIVVRREESRYEVVGTEALIRWNNPELGSVLPNAFIPIAEETDLIHFIGDWILHETCKGYKSLLKEIDIPLYVSINFSAKQLRSSMIVTKLLKIIEIAGIEPNNLQLELTETSYLDEEAKVISNLAELEKLGFRIAIDDFGDGYASLVYLQKLPASVIKIDKSFIKDMYETKKQEELVRAMIHLGKNLNKEVIAEGVDSVEKLNFLINQDCSIFQGMLFSKPLSLSNLKKVLISEAGSGLSIKLNKELTESVSIHEQILIK